MATAPATEHIEAAPTSKLQSAYRNRLGEFLLLGGLVSASLAVIGLSWRWPLVLDGPLFQYVAFLMDNGKVPYRDIVEMNGLGVYFSSWLEIHLFGYGDLGWRLYDLLFLLLGSWGIVLICKPRGRLATISASCLLILTHVRLGPGEMGERDFQMAILELLAAGFMLQGFRQGERWWFFSSGALAFLGGAVKPPGFLFLAAFVAQAIVISLRQKDAKLRRVWWMAFGAGLPCLLACAYLLWNGAWWPFVEVCRKLIPLYAGIRRRPWSFLRFVLDSQIEALRLLLVPSGLLLLYKARAWVTRESVTVLLGVGCALAGYWIQAKGFPDHLDPLIAFLVVWCGLSLATLMQDSRTLVRLPLAIALAFWTLTWVPRFILVSAAYSRSAADSAEITQVHGLEHQIASLRTSGKNKGIQIMDMNQGAAHALYDLRLVQSSGFLYDFYFYNPPGHPLIPYLRGRFLHEMAMAEPDLMVVAGKPWPDPTVGYKRMDQWPELQTFLHSNYELKLESSDYRIYVHR